MFELDKNRIPPLARASLVAVLVVVATASLGVSLVLAFSPSARALSAPHAQTLQVINLAVSALALALAAATAWRVFRRRLCAHAGGMITVCAWTRRVQWQGRWISFEDYLANRFDLRCTHGICDEAAEKLRDEHAKSEVPAKLRRTR